MEQEKAGADAPLDQSSGTENTLKESKISNDGKTSASSLNGGSTGLSSAPPKSPGPQPVKSLYIFSNIFEKNEDIKNQPFQFEKHNLKNRKGLSDYKDVKMKSFLIICKKQSPLRQQ